MSFFESLGTSLVKVADVVGKVVPAVVSVVGAFKRDKVQYIAAPPPPPAPAAVPVPPSTWWTPPWVGEPARPPVVPATKRGSAPAPATGAFGLANIPVWALVLGAVGLLLMVRK